MAIKARTDIAFPEIVFSGGQDSAHMRRITRLAGERALRRLYPGVYTSNLDSPLESVVLRNWGNIVGHLLPGAVLSFRSAITGRPENGVVYVTRGKTRRQLELPGLRVEVIPGPDALTTPPANDIPYNAMYMASAERGLLENLSRGRGVADRTLSQEEVEERLEKILVIRGEHKLNEIRDRAREVANKLDMPRQFLRMEGIVGALLGTHAQKKLQSRQALARASGRPYDPERLALFDVLFSALKSDVFPQVKDRAPSGLALENFAFFEAYFSNFIEGTTFEVAEAEKIVFEGAIIPNRSEDSHDVLGTFRAATLAPWRNNPPANADDFLQWLKSVNALVMQARPDKSPGEWKQTGNQAGNTIFVVPELVPGTLRQGFNQISALDDPFARALMTMFVVTEVHPFRDGNGRTARLALNCVLSAHGLSRISIPTVYREDYLLPLKSLSNNQDPAPYLRAMTRAQQWSAAFDYAQPRESLKKQLESCNAFQEDLRNFKLIFPEALLNKIVA
jgi:hypothetical protein